MLVAIRNRAMKFLSPTDYLNWPSFAERICFAHNAVPHESLGLTSPFEMDFGTAPSPLSLPLSRYSSSRPPK
jgi:hypothetical protein